MRDETSLAFPSPVQVILSVTILVVGVLLVYLLSKALKLRPKFLNIVNVRKEVTLAVLVMITVFGVVYAWHAIIKPAFQIELDVYSQVGVIDVLWVMFIRVIVLLPMLIAMKGTGQTLRSIGINRNDMGRMLALGLILSVVYLAVTGSLTPSLGGGFAGFSSSLVYGFVLFTVVGFVEEVVWRGYIQTRFIACSGTLNGLTITALFFSLWHFPKYFFMLSGATLEALVYALLIFPLGLLFGYIMLKSQNIIPSSIFHLFYNWNTLFWQLPYI